MRACANQITSVLRALDDDAEIIFAYEPVWAIGAQAPAPPAYVVEVARELRGIWARRTARTRLIYGGSAGPGLVESLADAVDGLFLGRFAHDIDNLRAVLAEVAAKHPLRGCPSAPAKHGRRFPLP